eukprot:6119943-Amphidinium_carterae.1
MTLRYRMFPFKFWVGDPASWTLKFNIKATGQLRVHKVVRTAGLVPPEDDPLLLLIINEPDRLHASLACVGSPIAPGAGADASTESFVNWFRNEANGVRISM